MSVGGVALPCLFGPYELLLRLGHGGMGQVYLARRATLGGGDSLCVLKTLKPELAEDDEYVGRFLDEVRTVMQLRHSGISHVFDAGQVDGAYYMAMEYLLGVTARDLWAEAAARRLDPGLAMLVVEEVLGALHYAHGYKNPLTGEDRSVVHRDVSPHNVIVTFEGEVKLIDFGLAESVLKQEHTESHVVMGKVSYMSPEQARGERVGSACDQFAAAVMLYELVSGERFYGTRNNSEVWTVVGCGGFLPDGFDELSGELRQILVRALAKDEHDRFPDCATFRAALEELHTRSHPQATRTRLRDFMQRAFDGARQKQDELLQRSALAASGLTEFTQTASRSASSAPSTTARLERRAEPLEPNEPTSGFKSVRLPGRGGIPLLAVAGLLAGVLIGGGFLFGFGREDAEAPVEIIAQTTATLPVPDTAASRGDAGPAALALEDVKADDVGPEPSPPKRGAKPSPAAPPRRAPPKRDAPTKAESTATNIASQREREAPQTPDHPATETTTTPVVTRAEPAALTNQQAFAIVKQCKLKCAARLVDFIGGPDAVVPEGKKNALLTRCAERCRR